MARVKPKDMIRTRAQAEEAMARINEIDRQFAEWDMNEANAIAVIRAQFAELRKKANVNGMEAAKALLVVSLEAWAEKDCGDWGKKTLETPFGNLGFRKSNPAVVLVKKVAGSFKAAVDLLDERLPEFVREVKEVNKEAILTAYREPERFDAVELSNCGLRVKEDEEFWVESAASKDLEKAAKKLQAA